MTNDPEVEIHQEVFNSVYLPYLDCPARIQVYFGGASSGKSVFIAQRVVYDLLRGGRNYLICRQVGRTLRGSVVQQIVRVIYEWGVNEFFAMNKTDGTITCVNGYQAIFVGLDDVDKLKSIIPAKGSFTDIWVEEATEADEHSLKQLQKRQRGGDPAVPKRLVLSFNPILQTHWIYKSFFSRLGWAEDQREYISEELLILKTTYKDNRFLTHSDIHDLESEQDQYFYNVYTLGRWGILGDVIFTNWRVEDLTEMRDQFTNRRVGCDFGFSNDPTAVGVSHYEKKRKTIYFYQELYEVGLTNDVLAEKIKEMVGEWEAVPVKDENGVPLKDEKGNIIKEMICSRTEKVVCDSAEPKSVKELRNHGVNAISARKGKDSVRQGINWLQQQTIIVDKSCVNLQNELQQYHWKKDAGGNSIKEPIDKNNHMIDGGLRYAYEEDMLSGGRVEIVESPFYS